MDLVGIALAVGGAGAALHGTFHRNSPVFGRVMSRLPGRDRCVALTFDDGPSTNATPRILDVLGHHGIPATFFALGRHVERWPLLVRRAREEGHVVANHGFAHQKLSLASFATARADIGAGTEAIVRACAVSPSHFRAPHGFRSPFVTPAARSLGQRTVGWTLGVWDSARPGVAEIVRRTLAGIAPGCILLLHDGDGYDPNGDRRQTATAVSRIIPALLDQGYRFVLLPECAGVTALDQQWPRKPPDTPSTPGARTIS